jgi:hypothetical protein
VKPTEQSSHTGSHEKEHSHGDTEPILTKRIAVHAKLAHEMKKEGISCEALPYGSHKLEREESYYSHNLALSSRLVTYKGLIDITSTLSRYCRGINMPKQDPVPLPYDSLQYTRLTIS